MKKKILLKSLFCGFVPAMMAIPATITSCASDREYPDFTLEKTTERFTRYLNFSYTIVRDAAEKSTIDNVYFVYNNGINVDFVYLSPIDKPFWDGDKMKVTFEIDYPHNIVNTGIYGLIQISGTRPNGHGYIKRFSVMLFPHDDFEVVNITPKPDGLENRVEIKIKLGRELEDGIKLEVGRCTISDEWGAVVQMHSVSSPDEDNVCTFIMTTFPEGKIDNNLDEKYGRFNMLYTWTDEIDFTQSVSLVGVGWHINPNI